ncbi:hypothetical protein [Streptomyces sp. DSM 40907]|uniref:hypothetical protein n=1 Tax=Streptomyces kutzneri TaxID=3051179 RepID=UPI0028D570C7|nr:hypothetical protein [Streptomyces sp. DSM 40907]
MRNRVVGGLLVLGGVMALFNLPVVLFPEMVDRQFHGGEVMLGLLYTAPAVGAVAVSATSGWLTRAARPGRLLLTAAFTGGLSAVGFGLSGNIWAAFALLAVGGAAGTVAGDPARLRRPGAARCRDPQRGLRRLRLSPDPLPRGGAQGCSR